MPDYTDHAHNNNGEDPGKKRRLWQPYRPVDTAALEVRATPARQSIVPPPPDAAQRDQFANYYHRGRNPGLGLDCPIRAGSGGYDRCGWRPDDGTNGFRDLTRVRDHFSRHGMICPKLGCGRAFHSHRIFKEHLRREPCDDVLAFQGQPKYPLWQRPEEIDNFFKSFNQKWSSLSPADAWLRAYKCLYPGWESGHHPLPSAFYRENADREEAMRSQHRLQAPDLPGQNLAGNTLSISRNVERVPATAFKRPEGALSQKQSEDSRDFRPVGENGEALISNPRGQGRSQHSTLSDPSAVGPPDLDTPTNDALQTPDIDWDAFLNINNPSFFSGDTRSPATGEPSDHANLPPQRLPGVGPQHLHENGDMQVDRPGDEQLPDPQYSASDDHGLTLNASRSTAFVKDSLLQEVQSTVYTQGSTTTGPAGRSGTTTTVLQQPSNAMSNNQHFTDSLQLAVDPQSSRQQIDTRSQSLPDNRKDHQYRQDTTIADVPAAGAIDFLTTEIKTLSTEIEKLRMHGRAIQNHTQDCHRNLMVHPVTHHDRIRKPYVQHMVEMFSEAKFQLF